MGLLDFFRKPRPARRRLNGRRTYAAARMNRLNADWLAGYTDPNREIRASIRKVRDRSRQLERDDPHVKKYIRLVGKNIVGQHGIRLRMRILQGATDPLPGELDEIANRAIMDAWRRWTKKGVCDAGGRLSWLDAQTQFVKTAARDGEILVRHVTGADAGNEFGYAFQLLEADHLDERYSVGVTGGSDQIIMGVQVNEFGRPVGYHVFTHHPGADYAGVQGARRIFVPASQMIHAFVSDRPQQARGMPWAHAVMGRVHMLDGYELAELVASRASSAKMGFIETEGAEYESDDVDHAGNSVTEFEPGLIEELPPGAKFTAHDPTHPTSQFEAFGKAQKRAIASGLDVSYNTLAGDLEGVNFSSLRQGNLDERDGWRELQRWTIEHFCAPIFENWLTWSLSTGAINLPLSRFDKFNNPEWQPRGWQWVDPQREAESNRAQVALGVKSRHDIVAESGRNYEETLKDLAQEETQADAAGVDVSARKESSNGPQEAQPPADPDADD